jgi:hypothetical protein
LPASLVFDSGLIFDLVINGAEDLRVGGRTLETLDNRISIAIAPGTYTPQQLLTALNTAFAGVTGDLLGPLQGKAGVSNLSDAVVAVMVPGFAGGQLIGLETKGQHIATVEFRVLDSDPLVRVLGFVPEVLNRSAGVGLFIQDVFLGGNLVAGVKQFEASASLGFLELAMDAMVAQINAGVSVELFDALGSPGGRIYVDELLAAATPNAHLLGVGGLFSLDAGQSGALARAPQGPATGVLAEDVGLRVALELMDGNKPVSIKLDVRVRAADTVNNTSVADLASDVQAAIGRAIDAWVVANPASSVKNAVAALKTGHTFVTAGTLELLNLATGTVSTVPGGALQFAAPAAGSLRVESRRLIDDFLGPVRFSDSSYARDSVPVAFLVIDGISFDAGGLSLLPPSVQPRIELKLPLLDVWQGGMSVGDALEVKIVGADALLNFDNLSWAQIIEGMRLVSNLLGQFDTFSFLNQSIPIIDLSVNDIFDIASDLANAVDLLGQNPAAGIGALQEVFANSFGLPIFNPDQPERFGVAMTYDAAGDAIRIDIPYRLTLADQQFPIAIDLKTLGEMIGGSALRDLMGPVTSLVDVGASALVRLQSTAMVNISLGMDLSSGALFIYDYDNNDTADLEDDVGTFVRLTLKLDGQDLAFNAALGSFSLGVAGGSASIDAQAGLFLGDAPAGDAGEGDGRHYLSSAIAVRSLREGDDLALIWVDPPVPSALFTITGSGSTSDAVDRSSPPMRHAHIRLGIAVGGETYYTASLSREVDAATVQGVFGGGAVLWTACRERSDHGGRGQSGRPKPRAAHQCVWWSLRVCLADPAGPAVATGR